MFRFFSWRKRRTYKEQTTAELRAKKEFLKMNRRKVEVQSNLPRVWDEEARSARRADRV